MNQVADSNTLLVNQIERLQQNLTEHNKHLQSYESIHTTTTTTGIIIHGDQFE